MRERLGVDNGRAAPLFRGFPAGDLRLSASGSEKKSPAVEGGAEWVG
jgi:hypothetical protein